MSNYVNYQNDSMLLLYGLLNAASNEYINDATATVTVKNSAGVEVAGETWPLSLSYIAASDGEYYAILADTLDLDLGGRYIAEVTVDGGVGLKGFWKFPFTVRDRIT